MLPKTHTTKSNEALIVREAEPSDAAMLIAYMKVVSAESDFLTFGAGDFTISIEEEEKILSEYKKTSNQIFMLAELDGKVVGALTVSSSSRNRLQHVGNIGVSVVENHWGKGVGSILIKLIIGWAREGGIIRKLELNVLVENKNAVSLYEKYGFEIEGTIRRDMLVDGVFHDAFKMGMLID